MVKVFERAEERRMEMRRRMKNLEIERMSLMLRTSLDLIVVRSGPSPIYTPGSA